MPRKKKPFRVRDPKGRILSVMACTVTGAQKEFLRKYKTERGEYFSVYDPEGKSWIEYRVTN